MDGQTDAKQSLLSTNLVGLGKILTLFLEKKMLLIRIILMRRSRKFCQRGTDVFFLFSHQLFSQRDIRPYGPPSRSNWTNCFSRGSVPVFLRKSIATCDFPGGVSGRPISPLNPCGLLFEVI